jgi:hypothetical protein
VSSAQAIGGLEGGNPTDELGAIKWMKEMQSSKTWKDRPTSKMFKKLFRYISGVNKEREEVEMTVPVLNTKTVLEVNYSPCMLTLSFCRFPSSHSCLQGLG